MSKETALSRRIAQLANQAPEFDGKARVISKENPSIDDLIDVIDGTVLASALTFDTGAARLTLHVAGRRLHLISDADGSVEDGGSVFGKPLAVEDETLRANAAEMLRMFMDGASVLAVVAEASRDIDGDAPDSMSVDSLRKALGVDAIDDAHLPQIERLLARVGDQMSAWILMSGNRLESTSGSVADISGLKIALTTQLSHFEQTRAKSCPSHSEPSITLFMNSANVGQCLGIATFENSKLLFSLSKGEFAPVCRAFRRVL